jgi:hypothetical protein
LGSSRNTLACPRIPAGNALNANAVSSAAGICSIVGCVSWREDADMPVTIAAAQHKHR